VESFDQSLKFLLQEEPADFVRFALGDPTLRVLTPLPSVLPSRGRDVDGSYLIGWPPAAPNATASLEERAIAHIEFHRRHQSLEDLAVDVAEAQIRLYRREALPVFSLVWGLYGKPRGQVTERCTFPYGRAGEPGSTCVYHRVNLRAIGWKQLLANAPPSLWPLVALTGDGACDEAVHEAVNAIEGRAELSHGQRADHLAVLWFVAEAEDVPVWVVQAYLTEDRLMESTLFRRAFEKGEAKGKAEAQAKILIQILTRRLGVLDAAVRERIHATSDLELLSVWVNQALDLTDAEQARRFVETLQKALAA
jgi:hypothetical protein